MSADPSPQTALVVATHGRHALAETNDRQRLHLHYRGKKQAVLVGDRVRWSPSGDGGVVDAVLPRRNQVFRQDEWRTKPFAANLDAVLVWMAVDPPPSELQLARALIAAADAGVPATLVLNKMDLPAAPATLQRLAAYPAMGQTLLPISLRSADDAALGELRQQMRGRTTLVLGPSGAGKSTLINRMVPDAAARVGEVSAALNSGRHTTTSSMWYWLGPEAADGALIDTPGFQEFGLNHIAADRLASLMPDIAQAAAEGCRFYNCTHRHEPGCAVRAAAEAGRIDANRLRLYEGLHEELRSAESRSLDSGRG